MTSEVCVWLVFFVALAAFAAGVYVGEVER